MCSQSPCLISLSEKMGSQPPKVITSSFRSRDIILEGFFPPYHGREREEKSNRLCPVHVLSYCVAHTVGFRQTQQLFVHYREHLQQKPLTKQCLAHWLYDNITQAHVPVGVHLPLGVHTRQGICPSPQLLSEKWQWPTFLQQLHRLYHVSCATYLSPL